MVMSEVMYDFRSIFTKRKTVYFGPYLSKGGSRTVQRGQRGTLRHQLRTILYRLTEQRGQLECLYWVHAVPKHVCASIRLPCQPEVGQCDQTIREHERSLHVQQSSGLQRVLQLR